MTAINLPMTPATCPKCHTVYPDPADVPEVCDNCDGVPARVTADRQERAGAAGFVTWDLPKQGEQSEADQGEK